MEHGLEDIIGQYFFRHSILKSSDMRRKAVLDSLSADGCCCCQSWKDELRPSAVESFLLDNAKKAKETSQSAVVFEVVFEVEKNPFSNKITMYWRKKTRKSWVRRIMRWTKRMKKEELMLRDESAMPSPLEGLKECYSPASGCKEVACAVCLEEFAVGRECIRLHCSNLFHEGCFVPWLQRNQSCPLCGKGSS